MGNRNVPAKPADAVWTDAQWKAIVASDSDILVAAAAGSGKTAVLVERIIAKIVSEYDPIDVDRLLIVTFTNASAAEMRHRITDALEKAIKKNPQSRHLRKQISLVNKASISTLHSFCLDIIRSNYYLLNIDPGFRIADATEAELIKDEVLEDLLEQEYGKENNESFFRLVDAFTDDRSDRTLLDIIRLIHESSRSHPNPLLWLNGLISLYVISDDTKLESLPFFPVLQFDIKMRLDSARQMLQQGLDLTNQPDGPAPLAETFTEDLQLIERLKETVQGDWQAMFEIFNQLVFSKAKSVRKNSCDENLAKQAKDLRESAKKTIKDLSGELFFRRPESFLNDIKNMKQYVETIVGLVEQFQTRFAAAKTDKGLVDYNDLEHMALEILVEDRDGVIKPSAVAQTYREKFQEVLVDEYQDTNMVQEAILQLVTKDGEGTGNMFMVGDVKQSIYRFRLAEPNLFMGKYSRFSTEPIDSGMKIDLNRNFRSRKEVLAGTNFLFKQLMGSRVGEIEYDEPAELVKGAPYPEEEEYPIELFLINKDSDTEAINQGENEQENDSADEELETVQLEARQMANIISKIIAEQKNVFDPKTGMYRKIAYRDIVILLRSMPWAPQIIEEFKQQGIPVYANLSTGYFEATEVAIMMSLLQIIDNPYQDIPLASVLRSPIVGLDEEELAEIRIQKPNRPFYDAVRDYCKNGSLEKFGPAYLKVSRFFLQLDGWRTEARQGALSELIWKLYRDTKYYDFVGGLPGGKQRQANLLALYNRARQYEASSFRGIFRFLRFIERMRERGGDLGAARALGEQEDVVRIMTIHSSKGLEFPVVIVAGLSKQFNMQDIRRSYLIDKDLGFAFKYVNPDIRITYPSLPQIAFKKKKQLEMISEEMRVLYVALTRAKEKLYLIGTLDSTEKRLAKWIRHQSHPTWLLPDYVRANATSYLDWIGPALVRHKDGGQSQQSKDDNSVITKISGHSSIWKIHHLTSGMLMPKPSENEELDHASFFEAVKHLEPVPLHSVYQEQVEGHIQWNYQYEHATNHRSKQSVSELKRQMEARDPYSSTEMIRKFSRSNLNRPQFMQEKNVTPAEKGTVMHLLMQHLNMRQQVTESVIRKTIAELAQKEFIIKEQIESVDEQQIVQFFETEIGIRLQNANRIEREIPFTMTLPASEVYEDWKGDSENILVQGVVDCIFEDEHGLVLLDYKTDAITDRFAEGFEGGKKLLKERYEVQVSLYKRAIEQILKQEVDESYIFFFDGGHLIKV